MSSANIKPKRTTKASRGFLAAARFSCFCIVVAVITLISPFHKVLSSSAEGEGKVGSLCQHEQSCDMELTREYVEVTGASRAQYVQYN